MQSLHHQPPLPHLGSPLPSSPSSSSNSSKSSNNRLPSIHLGKSNALLHVTSSPSSALSAKFRTLALTSSAGVEQSAVHASAPVSIHAPESMTPFISVPGGGGGGLSAMFRPMPLPMPTPMPMPMPVPMTMSSLLPLPMPTVPFATSAPAPQPERVREMPFRRRSLCSIDQPGVVFSRLPQELEKSQHEFGSKLVVIMVGLPARGKSFIVKKIQRYLTWLQYDTRVFNVGNLRRIASKGDNNNGTTHSHAFFDPTNSTAKSIRDELALESLEELIAWLKKGGRVGIHDATNSSRERRKMLLNRLKLEPNCRVLFIESICTDPVVLSHNIAMKLMSPDYKGVDETKAREDFRKRLENYERAYQTLGEEDEDEGIQYCKLINVGKKVIAYNTQGYLAGQCIFYLMNFNLSPRSIWLTRHGESLDNKLGKIGGDAPLSARGRRYGACLARFIKYQKIQQDEARRNIALQRAAESGVVASSASSLSRDPQLERERTVAVWTSMLKRTRETVEGFDPVEYDIKEMRLLNEIYAGICEGLTYAEIEERFPQEFQARKVNKLFYRYPGMGGESYLDVIQRLNPLIIELERMSSDMVIVTHRVVLRILLGYMMDIDRAKMPEMDVPLHTLYCVEPKPHGTVVKRYKWVEEIDWFVEDKQSM